MYSVIIADDERWVVESLSKRIPWQDQGFEVVGTAADGEEALQKISELHPDVVMTDIRMPVMSGLDVIEESRRRGNGVEFIVVSGYAEFAYAQKALQYGVAGYCLKPVEVHEAVALLKRIAVRLDRGRSRRPIVPDDIVHTADTEDSSSVERLIREAGVTVDSESPARIAVQGGSEGSDALDRRALFEAPIGATKHLYIIGEAAYRDLKRSWPSEPAAPVGVSAPVGAPAEIHRGIVEAIVAVNHNFMGGDRTLVEFSSTADAGALREALRVIEIAVAHGNATEVDGAFEALSRLLASGDYSAHDAGVVYNALTRSREPMVYYEDLLDLFGGVQQMIEFLQDSIIETIDDSSDVGAADGGRIDEVVRFVDENFVGTISLSELAERFSLSSSHLCRLFKRRTGSPLTQYVADKRIEYACALLRTTDTPIGDIAEEAGFDSYFYFARVFRRLRGMTPTAYRHAAD